MSRGRGPASYEKLCYTASTCDCDVDVTASIFFKLLILISCSHSHTNTNLLLVVHFLDLEVAHKGAST